MLPTAASCTSATGDATEPRCFAGGAGATGCTGCATGARCDRTHCGGGRRGTAASAGGSSSATARSNLFLAGTGGGWPPTSWHHVAVLGLYIIIGLFRVGFCSDAGEDDA